MSAAQEPPKQTAGTNTSNLVQPPNLAELFEEPKVVEKIEKPKPKPKTKPKPNYTETFIYNYETLFPDEEESPEEEVSEYEPDSAEEAFDADIEDSAKDLERELVELHDTGPLSGNEPSSDDYISDDGELEMTRRHNSYEPKQRSAPAIALYDEDISSSTNFVIVERARNKGTVCRICEEHVDKDDVRVGRDAWQKSREQVVWFHLCCFLDRLKIVRDKSGKGRCKYSKEAFKRNDPKLGILVGNSYHYVGLKYVRAAVKTVLECEPDFTFTEVEGYDELTATEQALLQREYFPPQFSQYVAGQKRVAQQMINPRKRQKVNHKQTSHYQQQQRSPYGQMAGMSGMSGIQAQHLAQQQMRAYQHQQQQQHQQQHQQQQQAGQSIGQSIGQSSDSHAQQRAAQQAYFQRMAYIQQLQQMQRMQHMLRLQQAQQAQQARLHQMGQLQPNQDEI